MLRLNIDRMKNVTYPSICHSQLHKLSAAFLDCNEANIGKCCKAPSHYPTNRTRERCQTALMTFLFISIRLLLLSMDQAPILSILFLKMYNLFAGQTFLFEICCLFFEDVSLRDPCSASGTLERCWIRFDLYEKN